MRFFRHLTISRTVLAPAAGLLGAVSFALNAGAGEPHPRSAMCQFFTDGSGYCTGTLHAFRNSSDPTAFLILQSYVYPGGVNRYVAAQFGGTYKYLQVPASLPANVLNLFDASTISVDSNLYVHWNAANQVVAMQFYNDSGLL